MHDVIRAPTQARSRKTMDDVYRSMEALLKERSFERITISDLATHADVAVGSIYARFKDKNALLAGLYLNTCDQAELCLEPLSATSRWTASGDERMVRSIMLAIDRFYRQQGHILVASVLANVTQIEAGRARVWNRALELFTALLASRSPDCDRTQLALAVKIALRFTTALMHQTIALGPMSKWGGRLSNKALIDEMVHMTLDLIARAREGGLRG